MKEGSFIATEMLINEQITHPEIRVIGENGEQLGIMTPAEAMRIADEAGLDLVNISPKANPPYAKLLTTASFAMSRKSAKGGKEKPKGYFY